MLTFKVSQFLELVQATNTSPNTRFQLCEFSVSTKPILTGNLWRYLNFLACGAKQPQKICIYLAQNKENKYKYNHYLK